MAADRDKRTETLVGLFLFVGLALLGGLIVQFGRFGERFQAVYTVTVSFQDASGVIKGSHVRLSGAKVGQVVKEPKLTSEGRVLVELCIRDDAPKLDRNSIFQITSLSLLGDKAIVITPAYGENASGQFLVDGDKVEGGGPSGLEALQSDAVNIASDAAVLMARARTTLSKVDNALDEVRAVTGLLTESVDNVNQGLLSEQNMTNFSDALANLQGASENIKDASLEIKPVLAQAQTVLASVDRVAEEAEGTFAQASSQISKLGPALDQVPEAVDSITRAADGAADVMASVNNKDGLLHALTKDKEVSENAKSFLRNLDRYGILGYRDDSTYDERDPRNRFRGRRR